MRITFMVGNGFDVGLGMLSRFSDYFPQYYKESCNKEDSLKDFAKLIDENKKDWSYFERQLGKYTVNFSPETKATLLKQFRDFELGFIKYLVEQELKLDFSDKEKISTVMLNALDGYYLMNTLNAGSSLQIQEQYSKRVNENHEYSFICFNYTYSLDKCLNAITDKVVNIREAPHGKRVDRIGKVVHVHGYSDAYPIMGLSDVSQIDNQELAADTRFTRFLVKPTLNQIHRTNHDKESEALINGSQIICVYGMSLGETDRDWWNRVLIWLANGSDRQLVLFIYDEEFSMSTQFDWIEKEDEIIDRLATFPKNKAFSVENLRNRIHIAVHKNIFEMDLKKKTEAQESEETLEEIRV